MSSQIITYSYSLPHDDRFFELSKEAGEAYSISLIEFWKTYKETGKWMSKYELQAHMNGKIERKRLHSDSFIGAMQQVHANLASWKEAKKVCPDTKPPYKSKFLQPIRFKKSQIRFEDGFLKLSFGKDINGKNDYFLFRLNKELSIPSYCIISYDRAKGWKLNTVIEKEIEVISLDLNKTLSIDLGVKRVATLFDGEQVLTISGKKLKGLVHYQNKVRAKLQSDLSKKQKDSNKARKLKSAWRKRNSRLQAIKQDILHKTSRFIVDYAIKNNIGNIVIGDCSEIHDKTNLGKVNNQQVQQNPEQRIKSYVKEKFECISGQVNIVSEAYTSQTCPCCEHKYKPKNREYICSECGFIYDRDGVGAINIYNENVSFGIKPERIRLLTRPIGLKFKNSNQLLLMGNCEKSLVS
ncbi:MAG: Transposase, IS605 OrfB family [Candidatus Woesebacteria bacterium GW2011_GWB1_38_5b]|uniref:Transposase, IS605 OrfB family n=1 Tax=Candidatus Woesebacteria bacterium GW2011_GWB1_38_5b TaxID=1618569 RepID=A0A0G0MLM5_9BACT|nr:MAG: Transposase, IS605 OrfB family [Candidatus Woesebacteria bacterium GW2011_GWB1_38_5b]